MGRSKAITELLQERAAGLGLRLAAAGARVVGELPGEASGPIRFAAKLGIDKATASRFLRAIAMKDGLAAIRMVPGPEPLRELARAAGEAGAAGDRVQEFLAVVGEFEALIRTEAGSRSELDAMLASFMPEDRGAFELKRKQSIFRAISELSGKRARVGITTAMIAPNPDGEHLDLVYIFGYLGLTRLRPDVALNFATRRVPTPHQPGQVSPPRRPTTLDGREVDAVSGLLLGEFSSISADMMEVRRSGEFGETAHYLIGGEACGPAAADDVVMAEVNRAELPRFVPALPPRRRFVYTDVAIPVELMVFDLILHKDLLVSGMPELRVYHMGAKGRADPNDSTRDVDVMDLQEKVEGLGAGFGVARLSEAPWYHTLLGSAAGRLGWEPRGMQVFRARVDYPLYSAQFVLSYPSQSRGE